MDPLTHEVTKQASKNLRQYIDVKHREHGFILSPKTVSDDAIPRKARYLYGTTKEYPSGCRSGYSDHDLKAYLHCFHHQQKQIHAPVSSPEKELCRQELRFHMGKSKYSSIDNRIFSELHIRPSARSNSTCGSKLSNYGSSKRLPVSSTTLPIRKQNQLIDYTAGFLATMVKSRQSIHELNSPAQQPPPFYISRNTNPSPRLTEDETSVRGAPPPSLKPPTSDQDSSINSKNKTKDPSEKSIAIMRQAKRITEGLICNYTVSITTGNRNGASTNAPIQLKLYGTDGHSDFMYLTDSKTHRVPFIKGQTDTFAISTYHVGGLAGITIGHDKHDIQSGWYLENVTIDDPIRQTSCNIPCNDWLSSNSHDHKTMRDLVVLETIRHKKAARTDGNSDDSGSVSNRSTSTDRNSTSLPKSQRYNDIESNKHRQTTPIGKIEIFEKRTSKTITQTHVNEQPESATIESHYKHGYFSHPKTSHQKYSPTNSKELSSDSDNEFNNSYRQRPKSSKPSLSSTTNNHFHGQTSIDYDSPRITTTNNIRRNDAINSEQSTTRSEKQNSKLKESPTSHKNNYENDNDNNSDFFDD